MAPLVPPDAVLVPVPGRTGRATVARRLAEAIAGRTGAPVADVLRGRKRESLYDLKRRGIAPSPDALGLRRVGELPAGRTPVLVDNVMATGTTAAAALAALPGGKVLVHSVAVRSRSRRASASRSRSPRPARLSPPPAAPGFEPCSS